MDDVRFTGPLFDGRAEAAIHEGVTAVRHRIAEQGARLAAAAFASSIRDDHGRFLHSITITEESRTYSSGSGHHSYTMPVIVPAESEVVTTDLATYGPWLEGTGSRNETTRFKGYHGFRRAAQELDRIADVLANEEIKPWIARCR